MVQTTVSLYSKLNWAQCKIVEVKPGGATWYTAGSGWFLYPQGPSECESMDMSRDNCCCNHSETLIGTLPMQVFI